MILWFWSRESRIIYPKRKAEHEVRTIGSRGVRTPPLLKVTFPTSPAVGQTGFNHRPVGGTITLMSCPTFCRHAKAALPPASLFSPTVKRSNGRRVRVAEELTPEAR